MKLYANSKPFSQVINPFQFDQAFSVHGDNWNLGCVWLHGKSGFEFKVRVLDLAIEREMQNGFHLHPPRNPVSNYDFMDFLYTVLVGKTVLVNIFFSACYACACETTVLSKTVQIFSCIPEILITKDQISLVQQLHRPATPYDNRPLNVIFFCLEYWYQRFLNEF